MMLVNTVIVPRIPNPATPKRRATRMLWIMLSPAEIPVALKR
jgi:hypothetical protein